FVDRPDMSAGGATVDVDIPLQTLFVQMSGGLDTTHRVRLYGHRERENSAKPDSLQITETGSCGRYQTRERWPYARAEPRDGRPGAHHALLRLRGVGSVHCRGRASFLGRRTQLLGGALVG